MTHSSVVGGSTAGRIMGCPGSAQLIRNLHIVDDGGSEYALEGTLLHEAIEAILQGQRTIDDIVGFTSDKAPGLAVDFDHVSDALMPALAQFENFCTQYAMNVYDTEQLADWGKRIPGAFGWIDVIGRAGQYSVILDWKFGRGVPVQAEGNAQLMFYAVGARMNADLEDLIDPKLNTLLVIIQPRLAGEPSIAEVTPKQLDAFELELAAAVALSQAPDAPLATGSHCRWCPAKPGCPLKLGKARGPKPADLAEALALATEMEDWARSVFKLGEQQLLDGGAIPGWKLVQKRATRKWVDEVVAQKRLRGLRYRLRDITVATLKSPAQMEKVVKAEHLEGLIESRSSGLSMVPDSDRRPAVPQASAALKNLASKLKE
jgi:hypothetical protein